MTNPLLRQPVRSLPTLRAELQILGELRAHLANLEEIYERHERVLLRHAADDPASERLPLIAIIVSYWRAARDCDVQARAATRLCNHSRFWFQLTRLGAARLLYRAHLAPAWRRSLVARSMLALIALTPRLQDLIAPENFPGPHTLSFP